MEGHAIGTQVDEAITDLERATRLEGGDGASHFNLGLALARVGRFERAKAELKQAALLAPLDPEIPYNLGAIYWRQADYPRAAFMFQQTMQRDPLHEQAIIWLPKAVKELKRIEQELLAPKGETAPKDTKKE